MAIRQNGLQEDARIDRRHETRKEKYGLPARSLRHGGNGPTSVELVEPIETSCVLHRIHSIALGPIVGIGAHVGGVGIRFAAIAARWGGRALFEARSVAHVEDAGPMKAAMRNG